MASYGIVDIHSHFFGPDFFQSLAVLAHPGADPAPGMARLRAAGVEVPQGDPRLHARRWLADLNRYGVDRMVTLASLPNEIRSVAEGAAVSEGRLIPFCLIDPAAPGALARVEELVGEFCVRGLVLFPAMHKFDLSDSGLEPFYREVERKGLPLLVHIGVLRVRIRDLLGLTADFDLRYATPARLEGALARHPNIRFVVPHFGGGYFEDVLGLGARYPNLSLDTSSSNSWVRLQPGKLTLVEVFRRALEVFGPRRVHFGTDSSTFPRGWRNEILEEQRAALATIGLGPDEQRCIFRTNTLSLLEGRLVPE